MEFRQVVPGDVLDDAPARTRRGAVAEAHLESQHQITRAPVGAVTRTQRIAGEDAPECGAPARGVEGEGPPRLLCRCAEGGDRRAGSRAHHPLFGIELSNPVESRGSDEDAGGAQWVSPLRTRTGTGDGGRNAVAVKDSQQGGQLGPRLRRDAELRRRVVDRGKIVGGPERLEGTAELASGRGHSGTLS